MSKPTGYTSIENFRSYQQDLATAQTRAQRYAKALEEIRSMVTDESGHNMQKVGQIANKALEDESA